MLITKVITVLKELFKDKESYIAQIKDPSRESDYIEACNSEVIREGVSGISEGRCRGGVFRIHWRSIL